MSKVPAVPRFLVFEYIEDVFTGSGWHGFSGACHSLDDAKALIQKQKYGRWGDRWHVVDTTLITTNIHPSNHRALEGDGAIVHEETA